MESPAATPRRRRGQTEEEKEEMNKKYNVNVKEFAGVLTELTKIFTSLVTLNVEISKLPKGAYLVFNSDDGDLVFNRKHLRSANSQFTRRIADLKTYFRVSKKHSKTRGNPSAFNGTYTPAFAGPTLISFFNDEEANFGPVNPQMTQQLADMFDYKGDVPEDVEYEPDDMLINKLPLLKEGYFLRNTSTLLFNIYVFANYLQDKENGQYASADDVMNKYFGGEFPASFFSYKDDEAITKIPMDEALTKRLIDQPINTYDAVSSVYPLGQKQDKKGIDAGFNPARFKTYFFQNITAANYYSKKDLRSNPALAEQNDYIKSDVAKVQMLEEHDLVKQVSIEWKKLYAIARKEHKDKIRAERAKTKGKGKGRGKK